MLLKTHHLLLAQALLLFCHGAFARNDIEPGKEFYTAIKAENPIVLDGDLSEWPDADVVTNPKFSIPKGSGPKPNVDGELVHFQTWRDGDWTGLNDHALETQVAYDDENVYLGIVVTDDYHENAANSAWNGDSLQLMIADDARQTQVALYNYALGGTENDLGDIIVHHQARPEGGVDTEVIVSRNTDLKRTVYEIRFPKESIALEELSSGVQFGLGFLINDGDEATPGQKGWSGWGAHSGLFGKSPSETALITLGPVPNALNIRPEFDPSDENTSVQMLGQVILSDGTLQTLAGSDLSWSKIEGPI